MCFAYFVLPGCDLCTLPVRCCLTAECGSSDMLDA